MAREQAAGRKEKQTGKLVKEARITSKRQVTIPAEVCRRLRLKKSDMVEFRVQADNTVSLVPKAHPPTGLSREGGEPKTPKCHNGAMVDMI